MKDNVDWRAINSLKIMLKIEIDAGHMSNWIVLMVFIRHNISVVLCEDNMEIIEGLGEGAMFDREDLNIAMGS